MTQTPPLPYLLAVPLLMFVTFFLLAQVLPKAVYRRVAWVLTIAPAAIWAGIGLISDQLGVILGLAAGLMLCVAALAWLAARIAWRWRE